MANSIIGAFYIGLFTASVGPGTPTDGLAAQALPQHVGVLCADGDDQAGAEAEAFDRR